MSSASVTNIPTGPVDQQAQQSAVQSDVGVALRLVDKLTDKMAGAKGGPLLSMFVVALITSVLVWVGHEALSRGAATERYDRVQAQMAAEKERTADEAKALEQRTNARIEALEKQQTEIRIQLASIARAVGAE